MSLLSAVGGGIPDSALTQNLVAWYRFEDGDARDYASNAEFPDVTWGDSTAHDGTVNGATYDSSGGVTDFDNGANSGAFDFVDSTDIIECGGGLDVAFGGSHTYMCWANHEGNPTDGGALMSWNDGNFDKWTVVVRENGGDALQAQVDDGGTKAQLEHDAPNNGWYHVALVYDSVSDSCALYVDGTEVATGSQGQPSTPDNEFYIGSYFTGRAESNFGLIDDVRVYDTNLSTTQINQIRLNTEP